MNSQLLAFIWRQNVGDEWFCFPYLSVIYSLGRIYVCVGLSFRRNYAILPSLFHTFPSLFSPLRLFYPFRGKPKNGPNNFGFIPRVFLEAWRYLRRIFLVLFATTWQRWGLDSAHQRGFILWPALLEPVNRWTFDYCSSDINDSWLTARLELGHAVSRVCEIEIGHFLQICLEHVDGMRQNLPIWRVR